jgi:hypothetical protein
VHGGRVVEELFLDGVLAEACDGAQPAGDGCPGAAAGLELAGEGIDVGAPDGEQGEGPGTAPAGELAQIQGVGLASQSAVAGQVTSEGEPLGLGEHRLDGDESS